MLSCLELLHCCLQMKIINVLIPIYKLSLALSQDPKLERPDNGFYSLFLSENMCWLLNE